MPHTPCFWAIMLTCALALGVAANRGHGQSAAPITIAAPALYPETLEADSVSGGFLVGSLREGAVYEVNRKGEVKKLIDDARLTSVLGIAFDAAHSRVLVTSSDLGVGVKHSAQGPKKHAALGIYERATGRALRFVDLSSLLPSRDHLINGVTFDPEGNAYVTDSFSPVIYKVTPDGRASVLLEHADFTGEGINLNGIVYHPSGHLLVIQKSTGTLYRIPVQDPAHFTRVRVDQDLRGGDGLLLIGDKLWLIANKIPGYANNAAYSFQSTDGWSSATLQSKHALGDVYPTTCAALGGKICVLSSRVDELLSTQQPQRAALIARSRRATINTLPAPASNSGITRTLIQRTAAHQPGWETRIYLIEYPPLAEAPVHVHPARGVGYVIQGEFESAFGNGPVTKVLTGEGFVDEAEVQHRIFRNPSPDHPLRFVVAYTMRQSDEPMRLVGLHPEIHLR